MTHFYSIQHDLHEFYSLHGHDSALLLLDPEGYQELEDILSIRVRSLVLGKKLFKFYSEKRCQNDMRSKDHPTSLQKIPDYLIYKKNGIPYYLECSILSISRTCLHQSLFDTLLAMWYSCNCHNLLDVRWMFRRSWVRLTGKSQLEFEEWVLSKIMF